MDIANVKCFSNVTFYKIQKRWRHPAIHKVYCTHKDIRFSVYTEGNLDISLIGDGRCDSPGYNAKYGTYTLMDSDREILDARVIHVGNVENSSGMEKKGLSELLSNFERNGLLLKSLTTDRHIQIRKFMTEEYSHVLHQFDIWHVGKSMKTSGMEIKRKKMQN